MFRIEKALKIRLSFLADLYQLRVLNYEHVPTRLNFSNHLTKSLGGIIHNHEIRLSGLARRGGVQKLPPIGTTDPNKTKKDKPGTQTTEGHENDCFMAHYQIQAYRAWLYSLERSTPTWV